MATATRRTYSTLGINDFSGGWNPRDAWSEIGSNELPDMMNMTLDEQGGAVKRLGLVRANATDQIANTGNVQCLYYSSAIDKCLAQIGADVYMSADGGSTWGASIKTFSTAARCHMVDFLGKVVLIHPVDKCFTYDGTTVSAVIADSPPGTCIAVWQNALWSLGDPANPSRVTRSELGGPTWTATPLTVDVRAKDDQPLTALGGGQGMDILGRDGIFVFKENSTYRINNATTTAYTVEDYSYGASGPEAIATNGGVTAAISRKGVIAISGASEPVMVSSKIEPLFKPNQINFAQAGKMVAVNYGNDRILFSLPFGGAAVNSLCLEYNPRQGWFAPHNFGISSGTNYLKNTRQILGGKVGVDAASYGYVYDVFVGGSDDGQPISARLQTRWYEPNEGSDVRFRRVVVNGRGIFTLYVKRNYDTGIGEAFPVAITGELPLWGQAVWGIDTYSSHLQQDYVEVFSLGHGRSISMEIQETSVLTSEGVKLLDVGEEPELGGFAIYGMAVDMVGLGEQLMGTVQTVDVVNGQVTDAGVINNNFGAVKAVVNGALDNSNVAPNAAIAPSKLQGSSTEGDVIRSVGGVATWAAPVGGGGGAGGGIPVGAGMDYWGASAPSGYLFADGSAVSRTTYAALFTAIGTQYGAGDGSTTFNLPDKRGRMSVGKGVHADVDTIGDSEGSAVGNRHPKHRHTVNDPGHGHTYYQGAGNSIGGQFGNFPSYDTQVLGRGNWIGPTGTGITVGPAGADLTDAAPYLVCNYIIFAGV